MLRIYINKIGELGWSGVRLCTVAEYKTALLQAREYNPKRPRDAFVPLDKHEYIELEEGIFVVNENMELVRNH